MKMCVVVVCACGSGHQALAAAKLRERLREVGLGTASGSKADSAVRTPTAVLRDAEDHGPPSKPASRFASELPMLANSVFTVVPASSGSNNNERRASDGSDSELRLSSASELAGFFSAIGLGV